jgi:hypothetical protein
MALCDGVTRKRAGAPGDRGLRKFSAIFAGPKTLLSSNGRVGDGHQGRDAADDGAASQPFRPGCLDAQQVACIALSGTL